MRVRCDPRFKWLSVVTIYVVCIVCLLDACPLPPSQLDHNTCASNPEQANSQVKIPFISTHNNTVSNKLCNDTSRLLFIYHFIPIDFIISLFPFNLFFFSISTTFLPCVSLFTTLSVPTRASDTGTARGLFNHLLFCGNSDIIT